MNSELFEKDAPVVAGERYHAVIERVDSVYRYEVKVFDRNRVRPDVNIDRYGYSCWRDHIAVETTDSLFMAKWRARVMLHEHRKPKKTGKRWEIE